MPDFHRLLDSPLGQAIHCCRHLSGCPVVNTGRIPSRLGTSSITSEDNSTGRQYMQHLSFTVPVVSSANNTRSQQPDDAPGITCFAMPVPF